MQIDTDTCAGCGGCVNLCPHMAIYFIDNRAAVDQFSCTECRTCALVCGVGAPRVSCRFPQVLVFMDETA